MPRLLGVAYTSDNSKNAQTRTFFAKCGGREPETRERGRPLTRQEEISLVEKLADSRAAGVRLEIQPLDCNALVHLCVPRRRKREKGVAGWGFYFRDGSARAVKARDRQRSGNVLRNGDDTGAVDAAHESSG
jgi:hypothetical protein